MWMRVFRASIFNDDDIDGHRRDIEFFLKNNLIRKTKKGKLYNISFKNDT